MPFVASIHLNEGSNQAAAQLEALINAGCFGLGAVPARMISYSMAVFKQ